jgi:8-oxo-dGTP pyrophosphatase MutT (NUDIX family)
VARRPRTRDNDPQPQRFRPWVSAGGVVWRRTPTGPDLEVVLFGRGRPVRWALPKGTQERGESLAETAVREVREETGVTVRLQRPLDRIRYRFRRGGIGYDKTVAFFLMQATGGNIAAHDHEYEHVAWLPAAEAMRRIAYPNEARLVEQAVLGVEANADPSR